MVDGRLDDAGWAGADDIPLRWEVAPGDNTEPAVRSVCHVTFDATQLYVGCRASDPRPEQIRAHLFDRDNVAAMVGDDLMGVYIDPFNDQRRAFIFVVNPLGVQAEGVKTVANQVEDYSWDAVWTSAGRITADGYEIEIAIPFTSLRFSRTHDVQTWGFIFVRAWPRNLRYRFEANPYDRRSTCDICQANKITGFEGIGSGKNIEISPTLTAGRTDTRDSIPNGPLQKGDATVKPGLDLRWGVTPNVSLNATIHPDFSQVEADVAQLNVNTRFALSYPEKRPFFLEGADLFTTPIAAVFSRTVADPDVGLKVTGKIGESTNNAVGVFTARDRLTNLLFPSNQGTGVASLDQDAWTTVGRYRRDIGKASYLGMLYAGRFGAGYLNQVGGTDMYLPLGRSIRLNAQYLGSLTEYPDSIASTYTQHRGTFSGGALSTQLDYTTNRWQASAGYVDLSPTFRADVGFVPRVDTRTFALSAAPRFYRGGGWFNYLSLGPYGTQTRDHSGAITDQDLGVTLSYQGPAQSFFNAQWFRHKERYQTVLYDISRTTGYAQVKPAAGIDATVQWQIGDAIDYTNARPAHEVTVTASSNLSVGRGLTLTGSDAFQRLTDRGTHIFTANIFQSKAAYNFNTRTMIRAILQYRTVHRNPLEYLTAVDRTETGVTGQFLFAYKVNPQAVLFLGYAENGIGTQNYDVTATTRTLFAKIGYGWRP